MLRNRVFEVVVGHSILKPLRQQRFVTDFGSFVYHGVQPTNGNKQEAPRSTTTCGWNDIDTIMYTVAATDKITAADLPRHPKEFNERIQNIIVEATSTSIKAPSRVQQRP
eukprot:5008202-Pyramimonas_sp.AAC.1